MTLLLRTGQRIGDWSDEHGRHGVLGMRLADVDRRRRTVTVRLKGARDEHRVPMIDDWWPLLDSYLLQPPFAEFAGVLRPRGRLTVGVGDPDAAAEMAFTKHGFTLRPVADIVNQAVALGSSCWKFAAPTLAWGRLWWFASVQLRPRTAGAC